MSNKYDRDQIASIISAYDLLLRKAMRISDREPFYAAVDDEDGPILDLDGDDVVISWREYDSDYYGGGHMQDYQHRIPASAFYLTDEELRDLQQKTMEEEKERARKLAAAQRAVERERDEARDRAEFARLSAKYNK